VVLAAKRYRASEHRMFHRDAGYVEGRRVRRSRETRAMANRTGFGRELLAGQWAAAEFSVLSMLWGQGAAVPYPVQLEGTELLLELIGDDAGGAPRLAQLRAGDADIADLWRQCLEAMVLLARNGYAHGDLSAYNLLVHRGRLVVIDLPQAVDIVANPQGAGFLRRDAENVCRWFTAHGIGADPAEVTERLLGEAGMGRSG
jgi:RIO kinase 1